MLSRDDIIRMAREAGWKDLPTVRLAFAGFDLERFAALVAALAQQEQQRPLKRATGWAAPKDRYTTPVLFNPYTGEPRDARDVQSDPQGILIVPPGAVQLAAKKEQHE
jgi:hypothetical protein